MLCSAVDKGTTELQEKRKAGLTAELVDMMYQQQLLTDREHATLLRFRWLYTIKFGVPRYASVKLGFDDQTRLSMDEPGWVEAREKDYSIMANQLEKYGLKRLVLGMCVFNQLPHFIDVLVECGQIKLCANQHSLHYRRFREVLDKLA